MDAWIDSVAPAQATGLVKQLYARVATDGSVDNVVRAHSLVPHALEALLVFYKGVMHGRNDLPYVEREMIAVTVSVLNRCHY